MEGTRRSRLGRVAERLDESAAERLLVVLAVVAVAGGVVLRFVADSPLWLDEALSVNIASQPIGDLAGALRRDGHPPLYYALLSGWIDLFGDGDVAARSLSGVLSVAALGTAGWVGHRFGGRRLSLIIVAVVGASPFAIRYGSEARMYTLLTLLVFAGIGLVHRAWRHPSGGRLGAVALTSGLLLLTHYWAFFLIGTAGLTLIAVWRWAPDAADRRSAARLAWALALGGVLFLPWLGVFFDQLRHTGTPWADASRPTVIVDSTLTAFGGGVGPEATLLGAVLLTLFLLGVATRRSGSTLVVGLTDRPREQLVALVGLGTLVVGAGASLVANSAFQGRYAAIWFPMVMLLVSVGIARMSTRAAVVVIAVVGLLSVLSVGRQLRDDRTQIGEAAAVIHADASPGDVVLFCPDQLAPAGTRALDASVDILAYPALDDGRTIDWRDYAERNAAADPEAIADRVVDRIPSGASVWLVWAPEYATFGNQCGELIAALSSLTGPAEQLVSADGSRHTVPSFLYRFVRP